MIRKYNISGRVQGVGFRVFVRNTARTLGLRGTVCNLADGSVECVAALKESAAADPARTMSDFEGRLRKGPPHSAVRAVQSEELAPEFAGNLPAGFEII
ncbi:MAG: acylphosphatase [bacterium]|nr:acylphosphatase [bacterium]